MAALLRRWRALPLKKRFALGFALVVAGAALALGAFVQRDTRIDLFATPLRTEQIAEVVDRLAEWNEGFTVTPDNVRVERRRRNALILKLSLAGVPHGHLESSSEALAKAGPLTPQSVLDAQQRDGLAGDIAADLRGIAGVADARVIVAPAVDGAFADEAAHPATASVRLTLQPGATLSRATVDAMRAFVAAAVPALDAKRVAVLDDRGLALGDSPAGSGDARDLEESLQSALDLAVGAGATIVRVRISYDPQLRELHDVVRKPLGSRAIASTTADERYKSSSKQYAKTDTAVDRGSEVRDERVDLPAGRLQRISVAVAVDRERHLDLDTIRSLARAALGLVPNRGDELSVEAIPFVRPAAPARPYRISAALGLAASLAPALLFAVTVLLLARFTAKPAAAAAETIVRRLSLARTSRTIATFAPAHVRGALANEPPHTAAAIISALPASTATAVLEMYAPEERAAIVRRMSRQAAPVVPDYETVLRRA